MGRLSVDWLQVRHAPKSSSCCKHRPPHYQGLICALWPPIVDGLERSNRRRRQVVCRRHLHCLACVRAWPAFETRDIKRPHSNATWGNAWIISDSLDADWLQTDWLAVPGTDIRPVSRPVWLQLFASLLVGWAISICSYRRSCQWRSGPRASSNLIPSSPARLLPQWIKKQTNKNFVRLTGCLHEWMNECLCVCVNECASEWLAVGANGWMNCRWVV